MVRHILALSLALGAFAIAPASAHHGALHVELVAASGDGGHSMKKGAEAKVGDLTITKGVIREAPPRAPVSGGYLTIHNSGSSDDRLIAASVAFAGKTEIHEMRMVDDVMKMRELADGLVIPAGETVELRQGGYHLMFMKIENAPKKGEIHKVVLEFANAGRVELDMPVVQLKRGHKKHNH